MSSLAVVICGLAGVALVGAAAAAVVAATGRQYPYLAVGHAHNDYKHLRPLRSALRYGFASVEADVWPTAPDAEADLLVGHGRHEVSPDRTLRAVYLEPLARRVAESGSVHAGQSQPFQLLVDLKSEPARCYQLLTEQLVGYESMLTRCHEGVVRHGAVIVVVTGATEPYELAAASSERYVFCDGTPGGIAERGLPATVAPLVSEHWPEHFSWRGRGPLPDDQRERLVALVDAAHRADRKLRVWGYPSRPARVRRAFWRELTAAGVDFLATDQLRALSHFHRRTAPASRGDG